MRETPRAALWVLAVVLASTAGEAKEPVKKGFFGIQIRKQESGSLVITGIVVAFAATAMAIALLLRLFQVTGQATLDPGDANDTSAATDAL